MSGMGEQARERPQPPRQCDDLHLSPPAGRGRMASAIRVRGNFREGGRNYLENAVDIAQDIIIPEPKDSIVSAPKPTITFGIRPALGMLSAVNFHNATDEVDCVGSNRVLSDELVPVQASVAQPVPQFCFGIGRIVPQAPSPPGPELIGTPHVDTPPHPALRAGLSPQAGRGQHQQHMDIQYSS